MKPFPATLPTPLARLGLPSIGVARKGALALGIKLAAAGLALALHITLARVLGHAGYGQYAYVFAWLQLMLIFAHGGFATAALRFVAEYRARCQPALVRGFLTRSTQIAFCESVVLALLMAGCAATFLHDDSAHPVRNFLIASAALPVLAQFMLGSAIVRGLGHVIPSMLVGLAQPLLLLAALLTLAHGIGIRISSSDALLLHLATAVAALAMITALRRRFECNLDDGPGRSFATGEWLGTATHLLVVSGLIYLQGRTGVIVSGLLLDAQAAGTYAATERLADVVLLGLAAVNMLVAPRFAALYAQGRRAELQRYARLAAWGSTSFLLATALPLVAFGKPVLGLFGDEFVAGYPVLLVLLGGTAVNAACGSVGFLLNMTGHHRDTLVIALSSLCLNLVLLVTLVPRYGILGTAAAFAVSMAWWNIAMLLAARRRLGVWACIGSLQGSGVSAGEANDCRQPSGHPLPEDF